MPSRRPLLRMFSRDARHNSCAARSRCRSDGIPAHRSHCTPARHSGRGSSADKRRPARPDNGDRYEGDAAAGPAAARWQRSPARSAFPAARSRLVRPPRAAKMPPPRPSISLPIDPPKLLVSQYASFPHAPHRLLAPRSPIAAATSTCKTALSAEGIACVAFPSFANFSRKPVPTVLRTCSKLVPTFRSSCYTSAPTFHELRKIMGTSKLMILVPLFYLKFLDRIRRL